MTGRRELDYGLGETIDLLRESVRGFVEDEMAPVVAATDCQDHFPPELWQELGLLGLLGINVPAEDGGAGMALLEHVVVMEEISRGSAAMGLEYCSHSSLCVNQLLINGSEAQKHRYLPALISGERVGALVLGGAERGSDIRAIDLSAVKQGPFYHLNGTTTAMRGSPYADVLIVYAATSLERVPPGISVFIVEKVAPGLHVKNDPAASPIEEALAPELVFDNCRVAEQNLLGEEDRGAEALMNGLDYEQLVLAGGALGLMAACLDRVSPVTQQHQQRGLTAPELGLSQEKVADMYTTWCACRAYVYTVARMADGGSPVRRDGAGALLYAAEQAARMVCDVLSLPGAGRKSNDFPAGRLERDAKFFARGVATLASRRRLVSRELFPENGR